MIGWQRAEIASACAKLSRLQDRTQEVAAAVAEMEKKGRELDAKGVRFWTSGFGARDNDKEEARSGALNRPGAFLANQVNWNWF